MKTQRTNLAALENKTGYFIGRFSYWSKDRKNACFVNIRDEAGNILTDHVWISIAHHQRFFPRCDYKFHGKVKKYFDKKFQPDYKFAFVNGFKLMVQRV